VASDPFSATVELDKRDRELIEQYRLFAVPLETMLSSGRLPRLHEILERAGETRSIDEVADRLRALQKAGILPTLDEPSTARYEAAEFQDLLVEAMPQLYSYAYRQLQDQSLAEEAVSDTVYRALRAVGRGHTPDRQVRLLPWLYHVMRWSISDLREARNRDASLLEATRVAQAEPEYFEAQLAKSDLAEMAAKAGISPKDWRLLELRFVRELKIAEIAKLEDSSPSLVAARMGQSLRRLATFLEATTDS